MVLYYIAYFGFLIALIDGIWKWLLGIIPLAFTAVMLKVCIERIKEIKKGESKISLGVEEKKALDIAMGEK